MATGEYAVHYSKSDSSSSFSPVCTVFGTLSEVEIYAKEQVAQRPDLRCRIYDHQGFIGAPIYEFRGSSYKGDSDLSPRFRRWVGSVLFVGGLILTAIDWRYDFRLSWPAMIGTRILIPGLVLLVAEAAIVFDKKRKTAHAEGEGTR